jgi:hypothetical protein
MRSKPASIAVSSASNGSGVRSMQGLAERAGVVDPPADHITIQGAVRAIGAEHHALQSKFAGGGDVAFDQGHLVGVITER